MYSMFRPIPSSIPSPLACLPLFQMSPYANFPLENQFHFQENAGITIVLFLLLLP